MKNEANKTAMAAMVIAACAAWASNADAAGSSKRDAVRLAAVEAQAAASATSLAPSSSATRRRIVDLEIAGIFGSDTLRRRALFEVAAALAPPIYLPGWGDIRRVRLQAVGESE